MDTAIKTITVRLTQDQINHRAKRMAEAIADRARIAEEKKAAMSGYKEQIEHKDKTINQLAHEITAGEVMEDVTCIVRKNFEQGVKEFIHEGEVIATVSLSLEERQLSIAQ